MEDGGSLLGISLCSLVHAQESELPGAEGCCKSITSGLSPNVEAPVRLLVGGDGVLLTTLLGGDQAWNEAEELVLFPVDLLLVMLQLFAFITLPLSLDSDPCHLLLSSSFQAKISNMRSESCSASPGLVCMARTCPPSLTNQ